MLEHARRGQMDRRKPASPDGGVGECAEVPRSLLREIATRLEFDARFYSEYGGEFEAPRYVSRGTRAGTLAAELRRKIDRSEAGNH